MLEGSQTKAKDTSHTIHVIIATHSNTTSTSTSLGASKQSTPLDESAGNQPELECLALTCYRHAITRSRLSHWAFAGGLKPFHTEQKR